jgi:hypothetical protein
LYVVEISGLCLEFLVFTTTQVMGSRSKGTGHHSIVLLEDRLNELYITTHLTLFFSRKNTNKKNSCDLVKKIKLT